MTKTDAQYKQAQRLRDKLLLEEIGFNSIEGVISAIRGLDEHGLEQLHTVLFRRVTLFELANMLIMHDDDAKCPFCEKTEWGKKNHAEKCPFGLAYRALNEQRPTPLAPDTATPSEAGESS